MPSKLRATVTCGGAKPGSPELPFKGGLLGACHRASEPNPLPSRSAAAELNLNCVTWKSLDFSKRDSVSFFASLQQTQLWKFWKISILSHLRTWKLLEMFSSVCHGPASSPNKQKQPNAFCLYSTNCAVSKYASLVPVFSCLSDLLESQCRTPMSRIW